MWRNIKPYSVLWESMISAEKIYGAGRGDEKKKYVLERLMAPNATDEEKAEIAAVIDIIVAIPSAGKALYKLSHRFCC